MEYEEAHGVRIMGLKIISLWEPWATLVAIGAKRIETRGWSTDYRGPVAIHATLSGMGHEDTFAICAREPFLTVLKKDRILLAGMSRRQVYHAFPHGKIIAIANLADCLPSESIDCIPGVFDDWKHLDTPQERAFGNYDLGRYGLVFENVNRLRQPAPFKSRQGKLLDISTDLESKLLESVSITSRNPALDLLPLDV